MIAVRFVSMIIRLGIFLGMCGMLKSCTLELMGKAAAKHEMMSYSKYTRLLTGQSSSIRERNRK